MYNDAKCPYCGEGFDVEEPLDEDELDQIECDKCGKIFLLSCVISYDYYTKEASCLNDGEHDWKLTNHIPPYYIKERCTICEEEREPEIAANIVEKQKRIAEYKAQKRKKKETKNVS